MGGEGEGRGEEGRGREGKERTTIRTKDSQTQNTYSGLHRTGQEDKSSEKALGCYFCHTS